MIRLHSDRLINPASDRMVREMTSSRVTRTRTVFRHERGCDRGNPELWPDKSNENGER